MAEQLHMIWPDELRNAPLVAAAAAGYELRTFREGDEKAHIALMRGAGFDTWDETQRAAAAALAVAGGILFAEEKNSGEIVGTAMALDRPIAAHPRGGELGWVAVRPSCRGRGLGAAVSAAATRCLLAAGYSRIYLLTDGWRLAAIRTYLKLGFRPFFVGADAETRWAAVQEKLEQRDFAEFKEER